MNQVLTCSGLVKRYGDRLAVDDVGFHIDAGETYGLLGPNGAGKSTTIGMICGLLRRDGGEVTVAGRPIDVNSVDARSAIGYVPQEIAVYPDLTARENLVFFGGLYGMGGTDLGARVDEVLEVVGLTERAGDRTETFSGGMQRRLNIAVGMLHGPKLLILDEPTVGVDPQSRNAILDAIAELGATGLAVLYTTHYMEEAERLCDRIGVIDEGRIVAEGTRRQLIGLVGDAGTIELDVVGGTAVDEVIGAVTGVGDVLRAGDQFRIVVDDASRRIVDVLAAVASAGADVRGVTIAEPDLEDVFLHLTGKALRD